jgi:tyrosine-protein kinase Etk/Wzc
MERQGQVLRDDLADDRRRAGAVSAVAGPRLQQALHEREPALADWAWAVVEGRWIVAGVVAFCLAAAAAYLFLATPVYQADAMIQVEEKPRAVAGLEELSLLFGDKTPAEAEIEIIRSRTLLGNVVDQLDLDVEARPRRFPLLGNAIARRYPGPGPAAPVMGLARFAWGGERLQVRRLDVSDDLLDQPLTLTALSGGRYRLATADRRLQVEGEVGAAASTSGGERRIETFVSELAARPGTEFVVRKRRRDDVVATMQQKLRVSEKGKSTGILTVELEGTDPRRVGSVVSAIATTYLRQNVERRSAEAAKTLEFLESQLPVLKSNLDAAESRLNAFKRGNRAVDLSREATALLERSADLEKETSALEMQRTELRQRFTDNHPNLVALAQKLDRLRAERAVVETRMRALPEAEAVSARLVRDVKVANELYLLLLNKAQEIRVAKSGIIGNVRIVDPARVPRAPASPNGILVFPLALLLGLGAGAATAIGRRALDEGAQDAEQIESGTGLPVYVTIPHSDKQAELTRAARRSGHGSLPVLFAADPEDVAVENLRSLRTSLQFSLVESRNNVVAVLGPAPGVGKSFVCVNLAHVLAAAGRTVLLVDADLRRGQLHRQFDTDRHPGLTDVLAGAVALQAAARGTREGQLHVLPTGTVPPNPAELLSSQRFEAVLNAAARRFDIVIVDTPPLLAVTDAALVARLAGVNLLVLRAGQHSIREIALTVRRLEQSGIRLQGAVLNDLVPSRGRYGGHYYHQYAYPSQPAD